MLSPVLSWCFLLVDDSDSIIELRQTAKALTRLRALEQANGINFYRPHAKQHAFHSNGDKTGRYCRTGNRGGKTKCGAAEDVAYCLGYRPWYQYEFDICNGAGQVVERFCGSKSHPLVTKGIPQRPVKLLLIVTDWDKSKEIFTNNEGSYENWGEYFQLIPKDAIAGVNKSRGGHIDRIDIKRPAEHGGGISSIYIDTVESYKHAKMSAESSDWDAIHLDEPCPRSMFVAHKRGLVDRNGKFWINCTPISEMWINDEFTPPGRIDVESKVSGYSFNKLADGGGSRFIITWSSSDNPHNSAEALAEFEAGLTREEVACRLHGLPLAMAGLVYREFVWDMHVLADVPTGWEDYHRPPKNYTIRWWWDFHTRLPQAVLFFATDPHGTVYVFDELFTDNLISPVCESINSKLEGYFVCQSEIDPFALIPNPVDGTCIVDDLAAYGLYVNPATKDKRRGINAVRQRLAERGPNGLPTIYFSPNLRETLFEFTHYVYNIDKQEPIDKDDHMMENLYRAVLSGLGYVEPPTAADYSHRRSTVIGRAEHQILFR